jgi:hypothetical protein
MALSSTTIQLHDVAIRDTTTGDGLTFVNGSFQAKSSIAHTVPKFKADSGIDRTLSCD